jgi:uncharacterized membrane protein
MREQDTPPQDRPTRAGTDSEVEVSDGDLLLFGDEANPAADAGAAPMIEPASLAASDLAPTSDTERPRRALLGMGAQEFGVLARAIAVLGLCGFSLTAFVVQLLRGKWIVGFVGANTADTPVRIRLLISVAVGTLAGVLFAISMWPWGKAKERTVRVMRTARFLSPAILPGFAYPLLRVGEWDTFPRIAAIAVVAVVAELCFRAACTEILAARLTVARWIGAAAAAWCRLLDRVRPTLSPEFILVLLGTLGYAAWMSYFTVLNHRHFVTMAFDLGSYNNMFYNALHGHPFRDTAVFRHAVNWAMLSNHADFGIYAFLPIYALHPDSETLLVLQAVALGSGAIPIYRFAARRIPRAMALLLAFAYLFYAPMHQANFYDVHFQPFGAAFVLWALDLLDARRFVLFSLFFVLALSCREDISVGFVVVGAYLMLTGRRPRIGALMFALSVAYFAVIKFAVMPRFGTCWYSEMYRELYPTGENSYGGVMKTFITNPVFVFKTLITTEKMTYFLLTIAPLAFLPLRRRLLWLSVMPGAFFTLLTTGYGPTVEISFQYVCYNIPFLFLAAAIALALMGQGQAARAKQWGAVGAMAVATLLATNVWGAIPPSSKFKGGFASIGEFKPLSKEERQKAHDLRELAAMVPKKAALAVSEQEYPHVSSRLDCLDLRDGYEGADYILYAENTGGFGSDSGTRALVSGEYVEMARRPATRLVLLRKKGK